VAPASAVATTPVLGTAVRTQYEVLGVGAGAGAGAGASRGEIKAAYRRLAREVHRDAAGRGDEGFIRLQCCMPPTMPRSRIPTSARDTTTPSSRAAAPRAGTGCGVPAEEVGDGLPAACFPVAT
jgi:hypothetical protein